MKHNGREIYNSRVARYLVDKNASECMIDIVGARKAKKKEELKNSPEYITNQNARNIAQGFTNTQRMVVADLRAVAEQTCKDTIKEIAIDLGATAKAKKINNYMQPNVSFKRVEEIAQSYLPVFKKLRAICYDEEVKSIDWKFDVIYKKLFDALIDLDIRFVYYAPINSINRASVAPKLEMLPQKEQEKLGALKELLEKNEDLDYVSTTEVETDEKHERSEAIVDYINEGEFKAKFKVVQATESLSSDLYQFIIKELNLQNYDEPTLKYKSIDNVLNICCVGLASLKKSSSSKQLNEIAGWEQFDPYTELFNRLIDINIRFAVFAPKSSLNRFDIDFKRMSEKERAIMLTVLKNNGLWDDPEYVEVYGPLFGSAKDLNV